MHSQLKSLFATIILVIVATTLSSQNNSSFILSNKAQIEIPFQYINGLIVIQAKLQNKAEVNLLLDTGAENLILFNKSIISTLGVTPSKKVVLKGADLSFDVSAQICRKIHLSLAGNKPVQRDFIVLDENFLKIDQALGMRIDGLVGGRLFWGMVMEIDYSKRKIILYSKNAFKPSKSPFVEKLPIEMVKSKPYIQAAMSMYKGSAIPIKLLLDTGSSMGLLLFLHTHPNLQLPEIHLEGPLGRGLGGDITGYLAKSKTLRLGKSLYFNNLITNYQKTLDSIDPSVYNDRNGILGNPILSKFRVTIDYVDQLLYLEASKNYNKNLSVDKTGMIVYATGPKLRKYVVKYVLNGTPAQAAGIKVGDVIKKIGWLPTKFLALRELNHRFAGKEGKTLKFKLDRAGVEIKTKLTLRDYLKVVTTP